MFIPILIISLIVIFFVIITLILITNSVKKEKEIYNIGIETDSIVSRVERSGNGYNCYVKYYGDDNLEHESILNASLDAPLGRKIKIKYISGKYDYVVFVSQELE